MVSSGATSLATSTVGPSVSTLVPVSSTTLSLAMPPLGSALSLTSDVWYLEYFLNYLVTIFQHNSLGFKARNIGLMSKMRPAKFKP